MSAQLGPAYAGLKLDDTKFKGLVITPEVRFYVKQHLPACISHLLSDIRITQFLMIQMKENIPHLEVVSYWVTNGSMAVVLP